MEQESYSKGFVPYGVAAFLVGIVGGFSAVLGPAFVKDLGLPYNNTTWTALATAMSSAACAPVLGKLADIMGRRRTLLMGLLTFLAGNVLTAVAPTLLFMLIARFIVGAGMAAIAPVVMAYILTEFPREAVAKGFSVYMLISSGSVVIGPTVGYWIIRAWGWRAMMWICAGICAAGLLYCISIREKEQISQKSLSEFDTAGAALVPLFFSLMLCIPSFGQNLGWDSWIFRLTFLASALTLFLLIQVEQRAHNPILASDVLKRKPFLLSVAALFLTQGLMQANMTNTIVFVNYVRPGNTVISGYAISVMYIGMALGAVLLGPLADRYEPRDVLTVSLAITAAGSGLMLFYTENVPAWLMMASLGILGFGLGGNGTIFMKVALSGISRTMAGTGTGTYGLFRDLAAPFGVAVLVPFFTNGVTTGIGQGMDAPMAAVNAVRFLATTEVFCILAGIGVVRLLPSIYPKQQ